MLKHIHSDEAAKPVAAYTQAVIAGDLVFVSGCIPINHTTGELISDSIENATKQSLTNVENILIGAGLNLKDVVKASVFMIDSDDYAGMNSVYSKIMPQPFPAREAIFVRGLPKGARVEISVIAHSHT
ncbi:MAG: reactive intermediate/imine deaminase [Crocinitomicaceae bacterium]|nr:reactive intermediate/imine deaminase [Crocinitomicaceae bacterium]|tara:strand:+ start:123 stop:506 length:384 start_codon:yes stop_codon:yes gene_type:complete